MKTKREVGKLHFTQEDHKSSYKELANQNRILKWQNLRLWKDHERIKEFAEKIWKITTKRYEM